MKAKTLKGIAARLVVVAGLGFLLLLLGEDLTAVQWLVVSAALTGAEAIGNWMAGDGGAS